MLPMFGFTCLSNHMRWASCKLSMNAFLTLLEVAKSRLRMKDDEAVAVVASRLWNSLPPDIRTADFVWSSSAHDIRESLSASFYQRIDLNLPYFRFVCFYSFYVFLILLLLCFYLCSSAIYLVILSRLLGFTCYFITLHVCFGFLFLV